MYNKGVLYMPKVVNEKITKMIDELIERAKIASNEYKKLTQEDVDRINAFQIRTCLVLPNTKGQSSEIIGQITTDNVYFSVLGGLDYYNKEKFKNKKVFVGFVELRSSLIGRDFYLFVHHILFVVVDNECTSIVFYHSIDFFLV